MNGCLQVTSGFLFEEGNRMRAVVGPGVSGGLMVIRQASG